jgi:hypothetical protein
MPCQRGYIHHSTSLAVGPHASPTTNHSMGGNDICQTQHTGGVRGEGTKRVRNVMLSLVWCTGTVLRPNTSCLVPPPTTTTCLSNTMTPASQAHPTKCLTPWYHDCNGACNLECRWAVGRSASPTAPTHEMEGQRPTQGAETLERGWAPGWGLAHMLEMSGLVWCSGSVPS